MPQVQYNHIGQTKEKARETAGGPSPEKYGEVRVWLPGRSEPLIVRRDPENGRLIVNPFRDPEAAAAIQQFEKENLLALRDKGQIQTDIRRRGDLEYDSLRLSWDRAEAERHGPDTLQRMNEVITQTLRANPEGGPGQRMVIEWPMHTDTGNPHVDYIVHRFAVDLEAGYVSNRIDLGNLRSKQIEVLNAVLAEEGLPPIRDAADHEGKSIFAAKKPEGIAREEVDALVAEEGGRPVENGAPLPQEVKEQVRETFTIEEERVARHARRVTDELAKAVAERKAHDEKIAALTQARADADHALEAVAQNRRLSGQVAALTGQVESLTGELTQANTNLTTLRSNLTAVEEQLTDEKNRHIETTRRAAAAEERAEGLSDELGTVRHDLAERTRELSDRDQELAVAQDEIKGLTESLTTAEEQTRTEAARANGLAQELASTRTRLADVETSLIDTQAAKHAAETRAADAEQALAGLRGQVEQMNTDMAALQKSIADERAAFGERLQAMQEQMMQRMAETLRQAVPAAGTEGDIIPGENDDALSSVTVDPSRAQAIAWPATMAVRSRFGKTTITTADGATVLCGKGVATLKGGKPTDEAIRAMVIHAQREGWTQIDASGSKEFQERIAKAASEAGIDVYVDGRLIPGKKPDGNGNNGPDGGTPSPTNGGPAPQGGAPTSEDSIKPAPSMDEEKAFVADAIAKAPADRTEAEQAAVKAAMQSAPPQAAERPQAAPQARGAARTPDWVTSDAPLSPEQEKRAQTAFDNWRKGLATTAKKAHEAAEAETVPAKKVELEAAARLAQKNVDQANRLSVMDYVQTRRDAFVRGDEATQWATKSSLKEMTPLQRQVAEATFKDLQKQGKVSSATKLDDWTKNQNDIWRTKNPDEAARLDAIREAKGGRGRSHQPE